MADFRTVHTEMWRADDWFQTLPTDARLFWVYLFTNPSASVSGIYKLPLRTMAFESGLAVERITELLTQFANAKKAFYQDGIIWVRRMRDYQLPGKLSPKLVTHLDREIAKIPDGYLKREYLKVYVYSIDTVSIPRATDTDTDTDTEQNRADTEQNMALATFAKARGANVNPKDPEYIQELVTLYGDDAVAQAITYCDKSKKDNFLRINYIQTVLSSWQADGTLGLHTPEYEEASRKKQGERNNGKHASGGGLGFANRPKSAADLEWERGGAAPEPWS